MISLKSHAISITAIFVALAIGIVLGSQSIASSVLSGLRDDRGRLQHRVDGLQERNNVLNSRRRGADTFDAAVSSRIVHGCLAGRSVVLFTTPGAEPEDVAAVTKDLADAGATITGTIALTSALLDPTNGDRLRTTVANIIPAGAQLRTAAVDQGSLMGDFLGTVLQLDPKTQRPRATPSELGLALDTLGDGGFLGYGGATVRPGQSAVLLTGNSEDNDNAGAILTHFAGGLRERGAAMVLGGRPGSADGNGAVAMIRSDASMTSRVSTVDDIDAPAGRITTALALAEQFAGGAGRYGIAAEANAVTVGARSGEADR